MRPEFMHTNVPSHVIRNHAVANTQSASKKYNSSKCLEKTLNITGIETIYLITLIRDGLKIAEETEEFDVDMNVRKDLTGTTQLFSPVEGPSSQLDKLLPGQEIKFNNEDLISNQGNFILGFFVLKSNNYYLGIWYNDNRQRLDNLVWVANRDTPVLDNSGSLTIDNNGNLKISNNGSLSIVLYSGEERGNNTIAVLLDNGNFVLREQSSGRQLWQSFDYPTHVLLPGMKLGVNQKTGQTWSLRSWRGSMVPEVGSFTFGLDPNQTNRLVILWHGNIYWTSEPWNNGSFKYLYSNYYFSHVSNENETYVNYSLINQDFTKSPSLTIDYLGYLNDSGGAIVYCSPFAYNPFYFGFRKWMCDEKAT
nr:g-type lectin s-receptor-like serine/threonine-protein kinase [Quercus suber]